MKISIVTISYNQARFLEQAIRSVVEQDYRDFEYIVVDPGSTDGSREIIERYLNRIDQVIFEPDNGPADGLNKGLARATGNVYGFINSDDALLPGALSKIARAFKERPGADVLSGHLYQVNERQLLVKRLRASRFHPTRFVYGGVQIAQQSTFVRSKAFWDVGGFNVANRTSWDAELLLDMACCGREFGVINEYLAIFRMHSESISGSGRLQKLYQQDTKRYFAKVMGRQPHWGDTVLRQFHRLGKWNKDRRGMFVRLYDGLITPLAPKVVNISEPRNRR